MPLRMDYSRPTKGGQEILAARGNSTVVFTTTYSGDLYAFSAATGAILLKASPSAGTNAPVTIDGYYVIFGAANALSGGQRPLIRLKTRSQGQARPHRALIRDLVDTR